MFQAWWLGVILVIFGSLSSAIGLLLMKSSTDTEGDFPFLQRRKWMLGFVFLVVNATAIDLLAYAMTPLALIAPFAGLTIVFSTLLAQSGWLSKKEEVDVSQWVPIGIIVAGVAVVSSSGPHSSQEVTESNIETLLHRGPFMIFSCLSILGIVVAMVSWHLQYHTDDLRRSKAATLLLALGAASSGAFSQLCLKLVSSAFVNGHTLLKFYILTALLGLLVFASLQLLMLNSTLMGSPVAFAVPLYEALLVILTIAAGGTFFEEFGHMDSERLLIFCTGVLTSIAGLVALSVSTQDASPKEMRKLFEKEYSETYEVSEAYEPYGA